MTNFRHRHRHLNDKCPHFRQAFRHVNENHKVFVNDGFRHRHPALCTRYNFTPIL